MLGKMITTTVFDMYQAKLSQLTNKTTATTLLSKITQIYTVLAYVSPTLDDREIYFTTSHYKSLRPRMKSKLKDLTQKYLYHAKIVRKTYF